MNETLNVVSIALVLATTVVIGFYGLRISRTTDDLLVASRTVGVWSNASAISGEYLSAASFLGITGLVLLSGTEAFWFPIGYSCGYLLLLLFVAAPLRRSGARTIPDFIEARLGSVGLRRVTSVLVVIIGWLYIVPQFHGAALTLSVVTGLPAWVGAIAVASIVGVVVAAGGMRSITFVQAFHYWLKLTALGVPVVLMLMAVSSGSDRVDRELVFAAIDGPGNQSLYRTVSLMLALTLGTMGLPHVLVRFYTNPDGSSARRTTVIVISMVSAFYICSSTLGLVARAYAPDLGETAATADTAVLILPSRLLPGPLAEPVTALIVAGAFAAFLATSSGLVVSLAGVISQDALGGGVRSFRVAALACAVVPLAVFFVTVPNGLTTSVGLAFVVAASSLSPVLLLGVWWRGLSASGALAGMMTGGLSVLLSTIVTAVGITQNPAAVEAFRHPAAWTVPLAFATTIAVSLRSRRESSKRSNRYLSRLHDPQR